MIELVIAVVLSLAAGVVWSLVVSVFPHADPARAASRKVGVEVSEHDALRHFVRARLDPETATGLFLTAVIVFIVFGVMFVMIRSASGVVPTDVAVTRWAAAHSTTASLDVLGWVTKAGSTVVVVAAALLATAYALRTWRHWNIALFFFIVLGGQLLLANVIKVLVGRVRPDVPPFHVLSGASFPSGHATAAAATWAAVALVLGRSTSSRARAILAGTAVGIAVAVACSRVFLGAHWTSDVVGGLLLGWTWFGLCAVAFGGRILRLGMPAKEATPGVGADRPDGPIGERDTREHVGEADEASGRRAA